MYCLLGDNAALGKAEVKGKDYLSVSQQKLKLTCE